jgi:hypothetical protein
MQRDPMQTSIAADIGSHFPDSVSHVINNVNPPQIARAASDPGRSIRSKRQIHWFIHKLRTCDDFDSEAWRQMNLRTGGGEKRKDNDNCDEKAMAIRHGGPQGASIPGFCRDRICTTMDHSSEILR